MPYGRVMTRISEAIAVAFEPIACPLGFRRKRGTFRRELESGLVQLIAIGVGNSWSLQRGKFTVDLGIYIDEVHALIGHGKPPASPSLAYCEIRMRLPMLAPPHEDKWWRVDETVTAVPEACDLLEQFGLPFFAQLSSRNQIVETWRLKGSDAVGLPPRGRLSVCIMLAKMGMRAEADELLREELLATNPEHPYRSFLENVQARLFSV